MQQDAKKEYQRDAAEQQMYPRTVSILVPVG